MSTYVKQNGDQFNTQYGTPSGGIATLQAPDSATNYTATMQPKTGVLALIDDVNCQQGIVKGYLTNTPPDTPTDGDTYIIGGAPTGAWAGKAYYVAAWSAALSTWQFYTPQNGWFFNSNFAREMYRYTNGTWEIFYQEGTWTPTIRGETTAGTNTYGYNEGRFVRVGNLIAAPFRIYMSTKDPAMAGNLSLFGLPVATLNHSGGCSIGYMYGFTLGGAQLSVWPGAYPNQTKAQFVKSGANNGPITASDLANFCELYGVLNYSV